jgi:hypothetical protein
MASIWVEGRRFDVPTVLVALNASLGLSQEINLQYVSCACSVRLVATRLHGNAVPSGCPLSAPSFLLHRAQPRSWSVHASSPLVSSTALDGQSTWPQNHWTLQLCRFYDIIKLDTTFREHGLIRGFHGGDYEEWCLLVC